MKQILFALIFVAMSNVAWAQSPDLVGEDPSPAADERTVEGALDFIAERLGAAIRIGRGRVEWNDCWTASSFESASSRRLQDLSVELAVEMRLFSGSSPCSDEDWRATVSYLLDFSRIDRMEPADREFFVVGHEGMNGGSWVPHPTIRVVCEAGDNCVRVQIDWSGADDDSEFSRESDLLLPMNDESLRDRIIAAFDFIKSSRGSPAF
jgi:hypothetical protein